MISTIVIVLDEVADLRFEIAGQVIVFEQNSVFERLMPALDLALRLRMVRRATDVVHALALEPISKIACYVG